MERSTINFVDVKKQIDKIDVKVDHKELVDIYYRLLLLHFVETILYSTSEEK